MKTILLLFALLPAFVFAQSAGKQPWKTDIALGGFSVTTFLSQTQDGNAIRLASPKNADRRVVGGFKSFAGRLFKKLPKKGRFINFKFVLKGDSAIGAAAMPVLGLVDFKGILNENENILTGVFLKSGKVVGQVAGHRSDTTELNYKHFYPKIMELANVHLFSRDLLQTPTWKHFSKDLQHLTANAHDDVELFLGFSLIRQQLPFSHVALLLQNKADEPQKEASANDSDVVFKKKTPKTGYLKIANFSSTQDQIASAMPGVVAKNYKHLIIDLRDNGGGGIEAAMELARFILKDSLLIGYFPTARFLPTEKTPATLNSLPVTTAVTTEAFINEMNTSAGKTLTAPKPQNAVFAGKLYILTNGNTASTCEPIAYVLKNKLGATLVGQTTAGAMLSAAPFTIEGKYKLVLPVADFYAYDGKRLEKVGVEPNIPVPAGEDVMTKVMALIGEGK